MRYAQSKYYNKKVVVDGIEFDSKKEGQRYRELSLMQRAGKISGLRLQVPFELVPNQYETVTVQLKTKTKQVEKLVERKIEYIADFVYTDLETNETVVEDVKGYKQGGAYAVFQIKRKLMLYIYGIKVKEI